MPSTPGDERPSPDREHVTRVLRSAAGGGVEAGPELLQLAYEELRRLAAAYLDRERPDHTLQPTALVHEAYLRLVDQTRAELRDQEHFLAVAAQAMRRVLVDHARRKRAAKRGGQWGRVELDSRLLRPGDGLDVLALDAALERLRELAPRQAQVVELRFFGGLEMTAVARVLGTSLSTVEREWRVARAHLYGALEESSEDGAGAP
jgi:RNA polymerase sigma factor (TIGR02999 family)